MSKEPGPVTKACIEIADARARKQNDAHTESFAGGPEGLLVQQIVSGRETTKLIGGKPVRGRKVAALALDLDTREAVILPWDQSTDEPIISIDTLARSNPDLAKRVKRALGRSPRHKVKR